MTDPHNRASPGSVVPDPIHPRRRAHRPDAPDSPYLSRILQIVREEFADMVDAPEMDQIVSAIVRRVERGT